MISAERASVFERHPAHHFYLFSSLQAHAKQLELTRAIRTAPEAAESAHTAQSVSPSAGCPPTALFRFETAANGSPAYLVPSLAAAERPAQRARQRATQQPVQFSLLL